MEDNQSGRRSQVDLRREICRLQLSTPDFFDLAKGKRYNVTGISLMGVNWIRRGSRGSGGMSSCPRLVKLVEIKYNC